MKIKNLVMNSLKDKNFRIMMRKLAKRLEVDKSDEARVWASSKAVASTEDFCRKIDAQLFQEIKQDIQDIEAKANKRLNELDIHLGGGGNYVLLYFLIRKFKPSNVVETGVAAGWTSLAILEALTKNGSGVLLSSDFPYFRLAKPEQYIGFLVNEEHLKERWHLDIRGDEISLSEINSFLDAQEIDLFHYDSDKSYSGRKFALDVLHEKFSADSIIIFDDIQDNLHFKDWVELNGLTYTVLEFEGKYVGLVGV